MSGKEGVAAIHGRAADRVFDQIGVDVDAAIVKEQSEAVCRASTTLSARDNHLGRFSGR
jgi:hypothetical protein